MYIANPIYDTVFKYLLEDNALAKLLIFPGTCAGAHRRPGCHSDSQTAGQRRTEVEELLQVFDQGRIHGDPHRLLILEK